MIKVDYVFHITPEAEKVIQKVAETLAQAIATDTRIQAEQTKETNTDEAVKHASVGEDSMDSTKESDHADAGIDQNKSQFDPIDDITDEKLRTFTRSTWTSNYYSRNLPEPDVIKQITSSLTGYHDLFNEITCIQQPQANLLIVDRFTKGNPIHHKRYMLNVDKNKDNSYTLRVALDDFTLSFQFTSENIVNTVRHLVKVVISSDVLG